MGLPDIEDAPQGRDQPDEAQPDWLEAFHRGDRRVLERCYRQHFAVVERAARGLLGPADRETVIHEVFSQLIGRAEMRRSFRGGSLAAWLVAVTRNQALAYRRKIGREVGTDRAAGEEPVSPGFEEETHARLLLERFQREHLSPPWQPVFELCLLRQMSQRDAARMLGLSRTTLAYRELRIRRALRRFLEGDEP
jgi:RNA polymerase sigma-70 factor, ECF subfamily